MSRPLAVLLVAVLLLLPLAAAGPQPGHVADPAGDTTVVAGYAVARTSFPATLAGCRADAADLLGVRVASVGGWLELRLLVRGMGAAPVCQSLALPAAPAAYRVHLANAAWDLWALGGAACEGGSWACATLRAPAGAVLHAAPAEGWVEGNEWVFRIPLSGTTTDGTPYDLRGQAYQLAADAQQDVVAPSIAYAIDEARGHISIG